MSKFSQRLQTLVKSFRIGPEQMGIETLRQILFRAFIPTMLVLSTYFVVSLTQSGLGFALAVAIAVAVFLLAALEGSRFRRTSSVIAKNQAKINGIRSDLIAQEYIADGPRLLGNLLPITWNHGTISPDLAELLIQLVLLNRPVRILEIGPGASTIAMAMALSLRSEGHIYSVEHASAWIDKVESDLIKHGLDHYVTIKESPLIKQTLEGNSLTWYRDLDWITANGPYDLVFIDAPHGERPTDPGREGALYAVWEATSPNAIFVLDDGDRAHETSCACAWQGRYGDSLQVEKVSLRKGAWLFRKNS